MIDELRDKNLRAIQYFFADGSFEFGFGLLCLLCLILAIFFFLQSHLQGWFSALIDGSLVLVLLGGAWLVNRLIRRLKEQITWPRTGYVAYRRPEGRKRGLRMLLGLLCGGLIAGLFAALVELWNGRVTAMPLLSGLLLGVVFLILAWRTRLMRYALLAGVSAAVGVSLSFSRLEDVPAVTAYWLVFGLVLILAGACVLRSYLRQNPREEQGQTHGQ